MFGFLSFLILTFHDLSLEILIGMKEEKRVKQAKNTERILSAGMWHGARLWSVCLVGGKRLFIGEGKQDDKISSLTKRIKAYVGKSLGGGKGFGVVCTVIGWTWSSSDFGIFWLLSREEPAGGWGNWCFWRRRNSCLSTSVGRKFSSLLLTHKVYL